jgi:hypothetical protein
MRNDAEVPLGAHVHAHATLWNGHVDLGAESEGARMDADEVRC